MARRPPLIPFADAARLFKAAKAAGYARARLIAHGDGRIEIVGEEGAEAEELSPFDAWKKGRDEGQS